MISLRLKAVAEFIEIHDKVIDIACDHALLDIYLVRNKKLSNIIVSDVNQNALDNAIDNINKYNLSDEITPILSDGLDNINHQDKDTIIISGLGTRTIIKILKDIKKYKHISKLVIQANNDHYYLRSYLIKFGFYINNESLVKDANINYITIEFLRGKKRYKYKDLMFGPILSKDYKNKTYYEETLNQLELILNKIPENLKYERKLITKKTKKLTEIINELKTH